MKPELQNPPKLSTDCSRRTIAIWLLALVGFWLLLEIPGYVLGRPYYDDEFDPVFMSRLPFVEIVKTKYLGGDPHPFGHFLYLKVLFEIFGSHEAVAFGGSLVCASFALLFLFLAYLKLGGSNPIFALVLLGLNPMFLLHGSAARWYPLWTFLAAVSFYLLVRNPQPSNRDVSLVSVLMAAAFYVNYLTVFYVFSVMVWLLFQREFKKAIILVLATSLLCLPWTDAFIRHLFEGSGGQFMGKHVRLWSGAYIAFTVFSGETMSPAHWASWILWFGSLAPLMMVHLRFAWQDRRQQLILILCGTVFLLPLLFGFTKARSFMFYSGILYLLLALFIGKSLMSNRRKVSMLAKVSLVCTLATCTLSFIHLSKGLYYHKQGLSDPIFAIVDQLRLWSLEAPTVVFTSNPALVYYLSRSTGNPASIKIVTPHNEYLLEYDLKANTRNAQIPDSVRFKQAVLVYSYLGSLDSDQTYARLEAFQRRVAALFQDSIQIHIKPDSEYLIKQRVFPDAHLEPYRFVLRMIPRVQKDQLVVLQEEYESIWAHAS